MKYKRFPLASQLMASRLCVSRPVFGNDHEPYRLAVRVTLAAHGEAIAPVQAPAHHSGVEIHSRIRYAL